MLVLFFTIVLIAQLIVTHYIVSWLIKLDKKVCAINQVVIDYRPEAKTKIDGIREIIKKISSNLECFNSFITEKKEICTNKLKKNLITSILFAILKLPGKRILTIIDIILMLNKIYKSIKK